MDKKTKKQVVMLGVLLVVLGILLVFVIRPGGGPAPAENTDTTEESAAEEPAADGAAAGTAGENGEDAPPTVGEVQALLERVRAALAVDTSYAVQDGAGAFARRSVQEPLPSDTQESLPPRLHLKATAILWSRERPMAVVNGRVVGEGDAVSEGVTVADIKPAAVLIKQHYRGKDYYKELSLREGVEQP